MPPKILRHLLPTEYEHPFDKASLDRLEQTRGIDYLTEKMLEYGLEKYLLIKHTGDHLRITHENIPELFGLLQTAARTLDMPSVPELYIMLEDKIKSFSIGERRRIVVISSGATELLNEAELLFLLGRELGHIKSNHVLYRMMADSLRLIAQLINDATLGLGSLLSMPLQIALMHWYRMSEFTADRAGLLTCQDPEVAAQALIKMAGLPQQYHGRVSVADLRRQATDFDDIHETTFDKLIRFMAGYENPQPFTIIRASQLFQWVDSGAYRQIMTRAENIVIPSEARCPACQTPFQAGDRYCIHCGTALPE